MRRVAYRYFSIGAFEKEEKWLNEMSAKGLNLIAASGMRYEFEEGGRGEYVYRLELLPYLPAHPESAAYLKFLEETGVEHIASFHRWVYLRKKAGDGPFEVYSDLDSRIAHYERIRNIATAASAAAGIGMLTELALAGIQYLAAAKTGLAEAYPYYPYLTAACIMLALMLLIQALAAPVRRARRRLLEQKRISE